MKENEKQPTDRIDKDAQSREEERIRREREAIAEIAGEEPKEEE